MLRNLDIFASPYTLKVDGKQAYKTPFGGIITLLCLVVLIVLFLLTGKDFYLQKHPRLFINQVNPVDRHMQIPIDNSNFTFLFAFTAEPDSSVNREDMFYFTTNLYKSELINGKAYNSRRPLKYHKCGTDNIDIHDKEKLKLYSKYYCIHLDGENVTVGGDYSSYLTTEIEIQLHHCSKNPNKKIKCRNKEYIEQFMNNNSAYVQKVVQKVYVNQQDRKSPFTLNYDATYSRIDTNYLKKDYVYTIEHFFHDQIGFIFYEFEIKELVGVSRYAKDSVSYSDSVKFEDRMFYEINLYFHQNKVHFKRSYMKIQELIAGLGGIMKFVFSFGKIVTFIYNSFYQDLFLVNHLFEYKENQNIIDILEKKETKRKKSNGENPVNSNLNRNNSNISFISNRSKTVTNNDGNITQKLKDADIERIIKRKQRENHNEHKNDIKLTFIQYYCIKRYPKSLKNYEAFKHGSSIVNYKFDVLNLVKFFIYFEYFKNLLLTESQSIALNFISKPNLFDKDNLITRKHGQEISKQEHIDKLKAYFKKDNLKPKDRKIISYFDYSKKK